MEFLSNIFSKRKGISINFHKELNNYVVTNNAGTILYAGSKHLCEEYVAHVKLGD